jgi:hypothetical protein
MLAKWLSVPATLLAVHSAERGSEGCGIIILLIPRSLDQPLHLIRPQMLPPRCSLLGLVGGCGFPTRSRPCVRLRCSHVSGPIMAWRPIGFPIAVDGVCFCVDVPGGRRALQ